MTKTLPKAVTRFQDGLLGLLGRAPETRAELVASMLRRERGEVAAYWLQLVVAASIATLGLVLGSTAVVIGAMLIAPLMEPIVNLGMGLAVGSPFLVLRSVNRVALSVVVVVFGSACMVWLLPFHDLNSEIAARTTPTALDLLTAGFCALAGVYATVRPGSDTTTTAAGTSIGISLVPPLCASGYGFGTSTSTVAGGAALLFLTNFAAIIFVATIGFVAAGMNQIDVARLESEALAQEGPARFSRAVARWLASVFASGGGRILRFAMPLFLLGGLYVPLRQALDEVAWQVRVRNKIDAATQAHVGRVVEQRLRVERGEVDLVMMMIGSQEEAAAIRAELDGRIREVSGVTPHVAVHAVPDAATLAGLAASLRAPAQAPLPPPPPPPPRPIESWSTGARALRSELDTHWPGRAAGVVLEVGGELGGDALRLHVLHHGRELGEDAREALDRALARALDRQVQLVARAVPVEPLRASRLDAAFLSRVLPLLERARGVEDLRVCVSEGPAPSDAPRPRRGGPQAPADPLGDVLRAALGDQPRVARAPGEEWVVQFARGTCTATTTPAGGAPRP